MMLSVFVILLIGVVAYFHYVQGFFSATLSAIISVIAAVLAVSYQETVVASLLKGKMADEANAMMMCVIFAAVYIVLRLIFDAVVPGNVRVPVIVDKVGAGAMGVVAGIFATGVVALAAQMLPFGPAVGGYTRYATRDSQNLIYPVGGGKQNQQAWVNDELKANSGFDPADSKSLVLPADEIVLATVRHLSDGGTLAGARTLQSVHPDYTEELFGQRLGIQVGGRHSALNIGTENTVSVAGLYSLAGLPEADPEFESLRTARKLDPVVRPAAGQVLLVARIMIGHNAADDADGLFRFSTGAIRLVANGKNYYPIGTVDNGSILMSQKLDDFLFLNLKQADAGIDAAFLVDRQDLFGDTSGAEQKVAPGRFIEVKRFAQIDLSDKSVESTLIPSASITVMRKKVVLDTLKLPTMSAVQAAPVPTVSAPVAPTAAPSPAAVAVTPQSVAPAPVSAMFDASGASVSSTVGHPIGVPGVDEEAQNLAVAGGTISLKNGKFISLRINPTVPLEKLAEADNKISDLFVPEGHKIVQVTAGPSAETWGWAVNPRSYQVTDSKNNTYPPNGVIAVVDNAGKSGLFARYDVQNPLSAVTPPTGTASAMTFLYVVPSGVTLTSPVKLQVP